MGFGRAVGFVGKNFDFPYFEDNRVVCALLDYMRSKFEKKQKFEVAAEEHAKHHENG